jgi:cytochrome c peroxidase
MRFWSAAIALRASGHPVQWICAGLLLFGIAAAHAPPPDPSAENKAAADEEPITAIPPPPAADPRKLALGEGLFSDLRLSANGDFACTSCHDIRTNGAGGRQRPTMHDEGTKPAFDIPTVFNAALSFRLGWEGNFRTLAAQAEMSIENPGGMHSSVAEVVRKLNADPTISGQFRAAYGRPPDRASFLDALVTFERSLVTPDSRFDLWLGGASALSPEELQGYQLFKAYGCSSCHQGVNVGGNLFERQGVFRPLVQSGPKVVRVPSLRNVATTAPYFHDGSAATLDEAVRRMAAAQLDRTLTDDQLGSLTLFLKTLTGNYRGSPVGALQ